tara:strand:+ start:24 stop:1385 length:1362 start_codon:yes stop_codon:yes gene_type:complete
MSDDSGAPTRHPIPWQHPDFFDSEKLDSELRRVFDICHGCRRCFNLCDSFPRLFDLVDEAEDLELSGVDSKDFKKVADACTLCDLCFMTMCPYTPPHEWNIDFPHLMLRYRAVEHREGKSFTTASPRVSEMDSNGQLARIFGPLMNWAIDDKNTTSRSLIEKWAGIDKKAALPKFAKKTLVSKAKKFTTEVNVDAPAYGRKAVLYATCFSNYHNTSIGESAIKVLKHNGVDVEVVYPQCCGMPQLEQGDIQRVAENAKSTASDLVKWVEKGYDVIAVVSSCALMIKMEWPLILPDDKNVIELAANSFDITEYIVDISRQNGLVDGLKRLEGGVTLHMACHARAQNMGRKAAEMLKLLPETNLDVIERCSGHGGSIGATKDFHDIALKVGRNVARQSNQKNNAYISSECPLASAHILEGMSIMAEKENAAEKDSLSGVKALHPIELMAVAYGLN